MISSSTISKTGPYLIIQCKNKNASNTNTNTNTMDNIVDKVDEELVKRGLKMEEALTDFDTATLIVSITPKLYYKLMSLDGNLLS